MSHHHLAPTTRTGTPTEGETPVRITAQTVTAANRSKVGPPRLLGIVLAAGLLAACGAASTPTTASSGSPGSSAGASLSGTITVFAASSLKEAFTTLGANFEAAHPGVKVTFSFAASSALSTQITQGAPADVFASASGTTMAQVVATGKAAGSKNFVKNVMEIAVPPANPGGVAALADLAKPTVKVALCQPQVPCGSTAAKVFASANITVRPVTLEPDVKSVLGKVTLGEVDAGVVYVTDVRAAGTTVKGIPIPAAVNASTTYPIAPLTGSANAAVAQAFVDYVLSAPGIAVLTGDGFEQP
jgi:molybdate transport system substrate-binding protein